MTLELGIALDAALPPDAMTELARHAEETGLDLVVTDPGDLDPWTTATWLLGSTESITIGIALDPVDAPDPQDPDGRYPRVAGRAQDSLELLAGSRLITDPDGWVSATDDLPAELERAAATETSVVVPVSTTAEVDRLARLLVEHGGPRPTAPRRTASVRARRRDEIAYDEVPASLAATAVEPGDPAYRAVRSTYLRGGRPGLVLRPTIAAEVADALAFADRHRHLPLGIRSGGHGVSGRSTNDGGLVIDLGGMNSIEVVDASRRLVRIGPGATWKQVAAALDPYGWALGSGDYGGVGVGGLATAGGIGFLSREHGLTIDHLVAVEMVLADGSIVRADAEENPDLFWGVRGAGANLGVVTAFEFEVYDVAEVGSAQLTLVAPDIEEALLRFGSVAAAAPRDTTVFLVAGRPQTDGAVIQLHGMVDSPDPDVIVERLTPFVSIGALVQQQVVLARYTDVMNQAPDVGTDGHHGHGEPHARSGLVPAMTRTFAHDAAQMLRTGAVYFFQLRTMGGAIADVDADATAFAHRTAGFQITAMGGDPAALDAAWSRLRPHLDGLYLSFETSTSPDRVASAFPPATLTRLRELKQRFDPTNLLRDNFNIDPSENQ